MPPSERLSAYWHSLRCQPTGQLLARLRHELGWLLYPRATALVRAWCEGSNHAGGARSGFRWPELCSAPHGHLGDNRFRFLNEEADFGEHIDWNPPGRSLLWRFHLHYFDWAPACDDDWLARHIESWIGANPPGSWPGWHPYPTSLRVVNWIRAFRAGARPRWVESLATQAAFLEGNLESHLGGNHLLENARALLSAGLYLDGSRAARWKELGLDLLRRELPRQVLADGGHAERSPYYHARVRRLVLDAIALLNAQGLAVPGELAEAAERMAVFEFAIRHTDGGLPQFHDSLGDDTPPVVSDPALPRAFRESGYYILEGPQGRLIADFGAPGDSANPAHQHAGIFSFEVSAGDRRVVVDSGTVTYEPGPQRDRLRSTRAHNTVEVDGEDQFQLWGSFRVGRRARVNGLRHERRGRLEIVSAAHDGYARLGVEHRRDVVAVPGAGWLIVDSVSGRGSHRLESLLHLAPGVAATMDGGVARLEPIGWLVLPFGLSSPPKVIGDTVSPAAGIAEASQTLVFDAGPALPCRFGYFLATDPLARLLPEARGSLRVETSSGVETVEVSYN